MTIIVEDGSDITDANSYVSLDDLRTYALSRGYTLPSDDTAATISLFKAMDYIEAQEPKFQGMRTYEDQDLSWPRQFVFINKSCFSKALIPKSLVTAQCWLACQSASGVDLMPNYIGVGIKSEKVGPLETVYSDTVNPTGVAILSYSDSLLKPLYSSGSALLTSTRV